MKKKNLVTVWLSVALSLGLFAIAGLIFMPVALNNELYSADNEQSGIPYPSDLQSSGILYVSEDGAGALIYLNFEQKTTTVNIFLDGAREKALLVGYEINYTLVGNDTFLCELCDRLGGIELYENGVKYRFTGAGLAKELENIDSVSQMAEISEGFFKKISKIGLSDDDFKFIIENTRTDLNFPACYSWREVISDTVSCYIFENAF